MNAAEFEDKPQLSNYSRNVEEGSYNENNYRRQPDLNREYHNNTHSEEANTHHESDYFRSSLRTENSYSKEEDHNDITRKRCHSNERSLSPSDSDYSKKARLGDEIDLVVEDASDVMQLMGFDGFNTTKNNHMYGPGSASFADIDPKNVTEQRGWNEDRRGGGRGGGRGGWGGGGRGRGRSFGRGGRGGGGGASFPSYNSRGGGMDRGGRGGGGGEWRGRAPPPRDGGPPHRDGGLPHRDSGPPHRDCNPPPRGGDMGGRGASARQSNSYNRGPPGSRGPPPGGPNRRGDASSAPSYNQSRWR